MSVQVTVAVIAAAVALLSAAFSAKTARSTAVLQARLQGELEERRERSDKAARLEQVVSRYRDPLLNSAFDLQSRIYNLIARGYWKKVNSGDEDERSYAVKSTLFVMAQYFAWAEALRRGVQFLDLGEVKRNRDLGDLLEAIRSALATDRFGPGFRIYRHHQRAIGELMLEATPDAEAEEDRWQCLGYASFCSKLDQDESFRTWFEHLDRDVRKLAAGPGDARARLVTLQNALIDLLDFLDQPAVRFPPRLRSKIDVDAAGRLGGLHHGENLELGEVRPPLLPDA